MSSRHLLLLQIIHIVESAKRKKSVDRVKFEKTMEVCIDGMVCCRISVLTPQGPRVIIFRVTDEFHLTSATLPSASIIISAYAVGNCARIISAVFNLNSGLTLSRVLNKFRLVYAELPPASTITGVSFQNCASMTSIKLPDSGLTVIPKGAFKKCKRLARIVIPDSVRIIGTDAFSGCSSLTSVILPGLPGLVDIGDGAFKKCKRLAHIVIPDSVKSIGTDAFSGCSSLASVILPKKLYQNENGLGERAFKHCGMQSLTIPDEWTQLSPGAFFECRKLESVTLPRHLGGIDSRAFYGCDALTSIEIPNNVIVIGEAAFARCRRLTSLRIPKNVAYIGRTAFAGCTGLVSLTIDGATREIDSRAFESYLIEDHEGVIMSIASFAFRRCTSLKSIIFPKGLRPLGMCVFSGCKSLKSVVFRPRLLYPFVIWAVGNSRNRNNWMQTTLCQLRHVLRLIAVFALEGYRSAKDLDPDGRMSLFHQCTSLSPKLTAVYKNRWHQNTQQ